MDSSISVVLWLSFFLTSSKCRRRSSTFHCRSMLCCLFSWLPWLHSLPHCLLISYAAALVANIKPKLARATLPNGRLAAMMLLVYVCWCAICCLLTICSVCALFVCVCVCYLCNCQILITNRVRPKQQYRSFCTAAAVELGQRCAV